MIKRLFKKYFDYRITGVYLDYVGNGIYRQRYKKKYFLKCFKQ